MAISMTLIILGITILLVVGIVLFVVYTPKSETPVPPAAPVVPGPPTNVLVLPGNTKALIYFTPPTNEGSSPITEYTVTSSPGNIVATGSSSPIQITGLTNDTAYTFSVVATNSVGNSSPSSSSASATPRNITWYPFGINFNDLNGPVNAILVDLPNVYVGGSFTRASGVLVNNIARFNIENEQWHALVSASPGVNGEVMALAKASNGHILVGGSFTTAGGIGSTERIARWVGSSWSPLGVRGGVGGGVTPVVNAIVVNGADIYLGGQFTGAGSSPTVSATNIVKWNGTNYTPLGIAGSEGCNGIVRALKVSASGDLFVGGDFTTVGGSTSANRVARYLDSPSNSWQALGSGFDASVYTLDIDRSNNFLYAGGNFIRDGLASNTFNYIAKYDTVWSNITPSGASSPGLNAPVRSIVIDGTNVYIGGQFTEATATSWPPLNKVTLWNGTTFDPLYTGLQGGDDLCLALGDFEGDTYLVAGGTFTTAGEEPVNNIAFYGPLPA